MKPFEWYEELEPKERKTFWACYGGWSLDAMDVQFYTFLIPTLSVLWSMSKADAGLIASSALVTSAVGGWIAGVLSDRFGRVRILQVSILWYSAFTAMSGFTNSFEELLVVRSLQGLGFGGEWTAGAVLMGEMARSNHRGKTVGVLQSGWAVGWALAAIISTFALSALPAEWGWRTIFFVGATPALLLVFIRRNLSEPDLFVQVSSSAPSQTFGSGLTMIFARESLRITVLGSLLSTGVLGGYYALMIWLPTFLRLERGLTVIATGMYLGVVIGGAFVGYIVGAYLTDGIGRRATFFLYAVCCIAVVVVYINLDVGNGAMLFLGFPLGFFSTGVFSGIGPFLTELFPTFTRGAGQGFCYNFGRAIGALFPALVGLLSGTLTLGHSIAVFTISAYSLLILAAYLLPETNGKELRTEIPQGRLGNSSA